MSSIEPGHGGGEVDGGQKVPGRFVIARGDGAKPLEFGEEVLNQMAIEPALTAAGWPSGESPPSSRRLTVRERAYRHRKPYRRSAGRPASLARADASCSVAVSLSLIRDWRTRMRPRASHERQDLARFAEWRPRLEQGAERIEFGAQRAHVTGVWVEHPGYCEAAAVSSRKNAHCSAPTTSRTRTRSSARSKNTRSSSVARST